MLNGLYGLPLVVHFLVLIMLGRLILKLGDLLWNHLK